jgi:hypothetical protein
MARQKIHIQRFDIAPASVKLAGTQTSWIGNPKTAVNNLRIKVNTLLWRAGWVCDKTVGQSRSKQNRQGVYTK